MKKNLIKMTVAICLTLLLITISDLLVQFNLAETRADSMVIFLAAGMFLHRLDFQDHLNSFREFGVRLIEACKADIEERFTNKD